MREWFKYRSGYVNIDNQYIYFTDTGNWGEAERLSEISLKDEKKGAIKRVLLITTMTLSLFLSYLLKMDILSFLVVLGCLTTGVLFELIFKTKTSKFKVKKEDIEGVSVNSDSAEIQFIIENKLQRVKKLKGIEEKGVLLMDSLKK